MISVIIPTLNEAERLPTLLASLAVSIVEHETIVADGNSTDGTADIAGERGARVIRTEGGRGAQLRAGADAARGEVLLFLHADSRFPAGGLQAIERALADAEVMGGNFRLLFDGGDGFSDWLNGFYGWIRSHGVYYGDSAVFIRRRAYGAIGGVRPMALVEDFDLTRRMERLGRTVCIDDPPLVTSSRRFAGRRPAAIIAGWLMIHALYYLRLLSQAVASPPRLALRFGAPPRTASAVQRADGHRL